MIQGAQWNVVCPGLEQKVNRHLMAEGPVVALGEGWRKLERAPEVFFAGSPDAPFDWEWARGTTKEVWLPERKADPKTRHPGQRIPLLGTDHELILLEDGFVRDGLTGIARPAPYVSLVAEECVKRGARKILFYGLYLDGGRSTRGLIAGSLWHEMVQAGRAAGIELVRLKPTLVRL